MKTFRRVPVGRQILRAAIIGATTATLLTSNASAAKPSVSTGSTVLQPSYATVRDYSQCDDGDGTATCSATSQASKNGDGKADASLRPSSIVATGRAEGRGGPRGVHHLKTAVKAIRYRFIFDGVSATAETAPVVSRDLGARAAVSGYIWHDRCKSCSTVVYSTVADADPFSTPPSAIEGRSFTLEVEVRNPSGGLVPAGTLYPMGMFLADVGQYALQPNFVSSGAAAVEGHLSRIEVQILST